MLRVLSLTCASYRVWDFTKHLKVKEQDLIHIRSAHSPERWAACSINSKGSQCDYHKAIYIKTEPAHLRSLSGEQEGRSP